MSAPRPYGSMELWQCGTMALLHYGTMALRHNGTMARQDYGSMALGQYGTTTLCNYGNTAICHYGTMAIWQYGNMALWHYALCWWSVSRFQDVAPCNYLGYYQHLVYICKIKQECLCNQTAVHYDDDGRGHSSKRKLPC